ncbi:MAG: trypsin-like peptidase domain-containing protein [Pirellulales bacterium]
MDYRFLRRAPHGWGCLAGRAGFAAILACCLAALAAPTRAQTPDDEDPTAEQREELYDSLAREADEVARLSGVIKKVVKLVRPTVVHINAEKREPGSRYSRQSSSVEEAGSGVVIQHQSKFYVLTNRHVIKDATPENIHIELSDRRQLHPLKVWSNAETDVAVLEVAAPRLAAARLGNSDTVDIGDFVLAVGSPFALSHSITLGIISAKSRRDLQLGEDVRFQDFLQTDAAINPGNSGGPLINLRGEVIGINTAIATNSGGNEGIGFSIPINMVVFIARQLIERGEVQRGFLGVTWHREFTQTDAAKYGLPAPRGAWIERVTPKSPADEADLRPNDVILQFNNVRVQDGNHLIGLVSLTRVGSQVPVVVFRDGVAVPLKVVLGDCAKYEACK